MHLLTIIILFLAALSPALLAQRTADYRDPDRNYDEGWTSLFNGKDLTGWIPVLKMPDGQVRKYRAGEVGKQSTFFVQNGSLKTTGEPNGYIRTEDVYDNYVFHMEVRFSQEGNSGVIIHVQKDAVWPLGIECQLYQAHMDRIFPIRGATLEGGEMIHASSKPPGEWNVYEVYSEEGRVATVLNGVIVGLASNAKPKSGSHLPGIGGCPSRI